MANRLQNETSPYLLQHAHNPVDWYPWGDEAFAVARAEDKPILLSIGYSACHWCHVMERESFENDAIAALMNDRFVNIKVDREERPDVDTIYMTAVQALTGHGGWPMTMFLTPEGKPFYGGTYFPPVDSRGMPGFPRVLTALSDAYQNRRDDILRDANKVTLHIAERQAIGGGMELLTTEILDSAVAALEPEFDREDGGFGNAPKFPQPMIMELLLRGYVRTGTPQWLEMADFTLRKMAEGGMYDQLGGGFHRYSVDGQWLVPHFEKMLYDNAQLSLIYLHAYQLTGNAYYRRIVEETLGYVMREMTSPEGGFYASQDADSEGVEGKFFVWSLDEVREALGPDADLFARAYDVTRSGNFEHANILHINEPVEDLARAFGTSIETVEAKLAAGRATLFAIRKGRVHPGRDDKVVTSWNGMMLKSFAEAAAVLDRDDYRDLAIRNAEFLLSTLMDGDVLLRTAKDGRAHTPGFLEDYANLADGLIAVYHLTFDQRWLNAADGLTRSMIERFWDDEIIGFFDTANDAEALIVRPRDILDNATPAGTSVAVDVMLRLSTLLDKNEYEKKAMALLRSMGPAMGRLPHAFGRLLSALDRYLAPSQELAIVGDLTQPDTQAMLRLARKEYRPNLVVAFAASDAPSDLPLLIGKTAQDGKATAYVCERYVCQAPTTDVQSVEQQLGPVRR